MGGVGVDAGLDWWVRMQYEGLDCPRAPMLELQQDQSNVDTETMWISCCSIISGSVGIEGATPGSYSRKRTYNNGNGLPACDSCCRLFEGYLPGV